MRLHHALVSAPFAAVALACSGSPAAHPATAGDSAAATPAAAAPAPTAANADSDRSVGGSGVPTGFVGRTDDSGTSITGVKYTPAAAGTWDVRTGPAHILYSPSATGHGHYTAQAEIDQVEAPHHPEAYGVFIGGQSLDGAAQKYAYFLVRGDGKYAIKIRDGADARTVVPFTASPNVPKADASGKASYALRVQITGDRARFFVNDQAVATVPTADMPTVGIAGLRINHNLHVVVTPVVVK
jgi:hypothetical protein